MPEKQIVSKSKMISLADAIRLRTGTVDSITIDEMIDLVTTITGVTTIEYEDETLAIEGILNGESLEVSEGETVDFKALIKNNKLPLNIILPSSEPVDFSIQNLIELKNNDASRIFYQWNLETIPTINTSKVTNMEYMFGYCTKLKTIPQLDTSQVTNMKNMFTECNYLQTIPELNTSKVTNMGSMFSGCAFLQAIPQLDTSKVTNMYSIFNSCATLKTIPELDTSNVTDMWYMFYGCYNLEYIPLLNTSKVTRMGQMFQACYKLTTIPQLDTSKVTDMDWMFKNCKALTTIPCLNTSNVTSMREMFYGCTQLITIPELDASKVTNLGNIFKNCTSLKSILMQGMQVSFDISSSTQFEREDLITILNNLATITTSQTLTMGATNLAKLTGEDKLIANLKGWTLI